MRDTRLSLRPKVCRANTGGSLAPLACVECMSEQTTTTNVSPCADVRVRTRDKYRMVYSDMQRLELEKEFHFNQYITTNRKTELSTQLG